MGYRLSAKRVFATWPQAGDYSLDQWVSEVKTLASKYGNSYKYIVCRERHQDGNYHFHAVVEFARKINERSPNFFDVFGVHGKYEPVRDLQGSLKYCLKDGEVSTNEETWSNPDSCRKRPRLGELSTATSTDEVLNTFRTQAPRDYFLYFDKIKSNCEQIFKDECSHEKPLFDLNQFPNADPDILHWYAHEVMGPQPLVSLASSACLSSGPAKDRRILGSLPAEPQVPDLLLTLASNHAH